VGGQAGHDDQSASRHQGEIHPHSPGGKTMLSRVFRQWLHAISKALPMRRHAAPSRVARRRPCQPRLEELETRLALTANFGLADVAFNRASSPTGVLRTLGEYSPATPVSQMGSAPISSAFNGTSNAARAADSFIPNSVVSAQYDPSTGLLRVSGTDQDDRIRVVESEGRFRVEVYKVSPFQVGNPASPRGSYVAMDIQTPGGPVQWVDALSVRQIEVSGLGGKDTLTFMYGPLEAKAAEQQRATAASAGLPSPIQVVMLGGTGDDRLEVIASERTVPIPITLDGGADNDTLLGSLGDERLEGGIGNDTLVGGEGNDTLYGHSGHDTMYGDTDFAPWDGTGKDKLYGGAGSDIMRGGGGNDFLYGESGHDFLYGDRGRDHLEGAEGWDTLMGGPVLDGVDTLQGGADPDVFYNAGSGSYPWYFDDEKDFNANEDVHVATVYATPPPPNWLTGIGGKPELPQVDHGGSLGR
jgi:hypothetical protein